MILHPNVVNASDINEMPDNALYVEGSVITRLLMGTVGLQAVRQNRVLVVIDAHNDELFVNAAVNAVSGARASYGLSCPEVICLDPPVKLRARFASSGRAAGRVEELAGLCQVLEDRRGDRGPAGAAARRLCVLVEGTATARRCRAGGPTRARSAPPEPALHADRGWSHPARRAL